jgi:hypothetical protein
MIGVHAGGAAKAFPYAVVKREKLVLDHVGAEPAMVVVGPDGESVRAFSRRLPDGHGPADFYRIEKGDGLMMDSAGAGVWNFEGCAISGRMRGACLTPLDAIKDYWFDWREYYPGTGVFSTPRP